MSDRNDADLGNTPKSSNEKVGDILHKERVSRRITVETIAKDLKLNVKYIKSLESSEYQSLPADPYVRVYLRSLAKYLSLNPEEILKKFYDEKGISHEPISTDKSTKLVISVKEKEPPKPTLLIAVAVILLLGGIMFIANQQGWIAVSDSISDVVTVPDSLLPNEITYTDTLPESALVAATNQVAIDSAAQAAAVDSASQVIASATDSISVRLEVRRDSVWVQVFSDGVSYKNILRKGQSKYFTAKDSFNIHAGNSEKIRYTLNNQPLNVTGTGVVAFKLNRQGVQIWPLVQWNTIFKERL